MPVLCIVGRRPEVVKMAPVFRALEAEGLEPRLIAAAQHREMLDQALESSAQADPPACLPGAVG